MTPRGAILGLVTLAHGLGALTALATVPLAPFLLEELALSRAQAGLFLPAVYLGGVLMALPAGWVTDRLGVRLALASGQLFVGAMILLAATSHGLPALLDAATPRRLRLQRAESRDWQGRRGLVSAARARHGDGRGSLPTWLVASAAFLAEAGALGWVGLYFALVAELGGARHAGLLTGAATACSWSGTIVGPLIFGALLGAAGGYALPWLALTVVAAAVALTLPRLAPLVQRA